MDEATHLADAWARCTIWDPAERGIQAVSPRALRRAMTEDAGLEIDEFEYDHTMFWPSYATFVLRRWAWPTGPRLTALLRGLHRGVVALTPGPLRSHTFWRLRKRSPLSRGGGWGIMPRVFVSGF